MRVFHNLPVGSIERSVIASRTIDPTISNQEFTEFDGPVTKEPKNIKIPTVNISDTFTAWEWDTKWLIKVVITYPLTFNAEPTIGYLQLTHDYFSIPFTIYTRLPLGVNKCKVKVKKLVNGSIVDSYRSRLLFPDTHDLHVKSIRMNDMIKDSVHTAYDGGDRWYVDVEVFYPNSMTVTQNPVPGFLELPSEYLEVILVLH